MDDFITFCTNNWQALVDALYNLIIAVAGLILLFQRTGTKRLNKKIDDHVIKDTIKYDLSDYYIDVDGKKVDLEKATIKKRR